MDCPNCKQPVEPGAAFCGNCGHALSADTTATSPIAQGYQAAAQNQEPPVALPATPLAANGAVPAYAMAHAGQTAADSKSVVALVLGAIGIISALFVMALIGLLLALIGLVLGTTARSRAKTTLNMLSIVFSSVALITSLGVWAVNSAQLYRQKGTVTSHTQSVPATTSTATSATTPCYSTGFTSSLTVVTSSNNCDMQAYEGSTFTASNDVYQIYGDSVTQVSAGNFMELSRTAIEKDFSEHLPAYHVVSEKTTQFAGSPAYFVSGSDGEHAVVEATVLHATAQGNNVFTILHGISGASIDLSELESSWQWK